MPEVVARGARGAARGARGVPPGVHATPTAYLPAGTKKNHKLVRPRAPYFINRNGVIVPGIRCLANGSAQKSGKVRFCTLTYWPAGLQNPRNQASLRLNNRQSGGMCNNTSSRIIIIIVLEVTPWIHLGIRPP